MLLSLILGNDILHWLSFWTSGNQQLTKTMWVRSRRPNRGNLLNIFSFFFNDFLFQEQLRDNYYWISDSSKEEIYIIEKFCHVSDSFPSSLPKAGSWVLGPVMHAPDILQMKRVSCITLFHNYAPRYPQKMHVGKVSWPLPRLMSPQPGVWGDKSPNHYQTNKTSCFEIVCGMFHVGPICLCGYSGA